MARPAQNRPDGEWSLTQVAKASGITIRTARTLVENQWLPSGPLRREHVAIARLSAALLDAPRPQGEGRGPLSESTAARYRDLLDQAYTLMSDPVPSAVAVVTPTQAVIANSMKRVVSIVEATAPPQSTLLLPVGAWIDEVAE